ncbi:hypothetical protein FAI40_10150 [Acetobacteraceae bacterium]|nr:hypothetical protein FAI40_10150 [Acetobacteraceae bacterium]
MSNLPATISEKTKQEIAHLKEYNTPLHEDELLNICKHWLTRINLCCAYPVSETILAAKIPLYAKTFQHIPNICWSEESLRKFCAEMKKFPSTGELGEFFSKIQKPFLAELSFLRRQQQQALELAQLRYEEPRKPISQKTLNEARAFIKAGKAKAELSQAQWREEQQKTQQRIREALVA